MRATVIVFPGSNCDRDVGHAIRLVLGTETDFVWHKQSQLPSGTDLVVLPGGFSYGDYLRCGAMAARSPIMEAVSRHADSGGLVVGICNGFQVLTESRLLPGALLANRSLRFICRPCTLRVERTDTPFTRTFRDHQIVSFPIAHYEGLYFLPPDELRDLERRRQVVFRYASPDGRVDDATNPNGAMNNIAGIVNERGNVLGLMPHPERAEDLLLDPETRSRLGADTFSGNPDGTDFWKGVRDWTYGRSA
jgi:phosphoribosylformylglycinamidine synthase